jgi:hypothetical protein
MQGLERLLGWAANLIQVATFIFTIWVLWRTRVRLKRYIQRAKTVGTAAPAALAVGIGGSIKSPVRQYLDAHEMAGVPLEEFVYPGFLPKRKFYDVLRDLHNIKQAMSDTGVTEVHLFYKGPVTLAMGIGSIFDNWVPVKVYELSKTTGEYEFDLTLGKGAVLELLREAGTEGEEMIMDQMDA